MTLFRSISDLEFCSFLFFQVLLCVPSHVNPLSFSEEQTFEVCLEISELERLNYFYFMILSVELVAMSF